MINGLENLFQTNSLISLEGSQNNISMKIKEEPIDIEMQTSKSKIKSRSEEVEIKAGEKFSATEEFANKTSIAFLNEDKTVTSSDSDNYPRTSNSQTKKSQKKNKNKLYNPK